MPASIPNLTIAIPTFDRQEQLANVVRTLLPQLEESVALLIIDNCSSYNVQDVIQPLLKGLRNVRFVRNVANVGMGANILRCFELAESEWIWVLGDDDVPVADAITRIGSELAKYPDAAFINFASKHALRARPWSAKSQEEFVAQQDYFGGILFLSASVYRVDIFRRQLGIGYRGIYSLCPHYAMLLGVLRDKQSAVFVVESLIIESDVNEWVPAAYYLSAPTLLEFCSEEVRTRLYRQLRVTGWPEDLFLYTLRSRCAGVSWRQSIFIFDTTANRNLYFDPGFAIQLRVFAYRFLLRLPKLALVLLRLIHGLTGKPTSFGTFLDFDRKPHKPILNRL